MLRATFGGYVWSELHMWITEGRVMAGWMDARYAVGLMAALGIFYGQERGCTFFN